MPLKRRHGNDLHLLADARGASGIIYSPSSGDNARKESLEGELGETEQPLLLCAEVGRFSSSSPSYMSMGFSLVAQALLRSYLPDQPWRPLLVRLGYPLGFLIVIIGRQQLFTENTLTAIIRLLARRNFATFVQVLRLWSVVLIANLVGAHLFAWVVGNTPMFSHDVQHAMLELAKGAANVTFGTAILRGIFCRMANRDGCVDASSYRLRTALQ